MIEHDEIYEYAAYFLDSARGIKETDSNARLFATRGVLVAAFLLCDNNALTFNERLVQITGAERDVVDDVFPDTATVRNVQRAIFSKIMPRKRTFGMPESATDLLNGLMHDEYFFTDMPQQQYVSCGPSQG